MDILKKRENPFNRLGYQGNVHYKTLIGFLNQFKITDKDEQANITYTFGRFKIDNIRDINIFLQYLNICTKNITAPLNFREIQTNNIETNTGSGIMYDFDLYNKDDIFEPTRLNYKMLIREMLKVIIKHIDFSNVNIYDLKIHLMVITKPNVVFDSDRNEYKYGFHIIIPSIKLMRDDKKILYQHILNDDGFKRIFEKETNCILNANTFDSASTYVPLYFLRNCKDTMEQAYIINSIYEITIIEDDNRLIVDRFDDAPDDLKNPDMCNQIKEFSVNYDSEIIVKIQYSLKNKTNANISNINAIGGGSNSNIAKYQEMFETYRIDADDNIEYYKTLVLTILSNERASNYTLWRNTIFAIANINSKNASIYKPLAHMFSYRCPEKYDEASVNQLWDSVVEHRIPNGIRVGSLIRWCIMDNKIEFLKINERDIKSLISNELFNTENRLINGEIDDYHCAKYIHSIFRFKYITTPVFNSDTKDIWYEFMTDVNDCEEGEIYKWIDIGTYPRKLLNYISTDLAKIINDVILVAEDRAQREANEQTTSFINSRLAKLKESARKLIFRGPAKRNILRESAVNFRLRNLVYKMDKDTDIMGVGNGVLLLGSQPKLIQTYHEYYISKFTKVDYIPYDNLSADDKQLGLDCIYSLFPDDEKDAFNYLMYYLSTSLDGKPKHSMIMILTGTGSNGKSFLVELLKNVFGDYGARIPLGFLTEVRARSTSAEPALIELMNRRFAFFSESEQNEILNSSKMKELTGNESVSGRQLYQPQVTFRPVCNYMITTNNKLTIKSTDNGTWRRVCCYEFKQKFVKNPDVNSKYDKLQNPKFCKEYTQDKHIQSIILSMLIEYYKDLQINYGGDISNIISPTIINESNQYRAEEDVLSRFIDSRVVLTDNKDTLIRLSSFAELYIEYYKREVDERANLIRKNIIADIKNSKIASYCNIVSTEEVFKYLRVTTNPMANLNPGEVYIRDLITNGKNKFVSDLKYNKDDFNPLKL